MATKKKATRRAPARKATPRRASRRVVDAPMPSSARPMEPAAPPKRNGYLLVGFVVIVIGAVFLRNCRENAPMASAASPAAPASAPAAAAPAPARSVASAAPAAAPKPAAVQPSAHRETAGETGAPSLEFDRASQSQIKVRCWRPAQGQAQLDVFGPRNKHVRSLKSASGDAGWQKLGWDGKDEDGHAVPAGLYYVRPSSQGLQQVQDVWVKG
jgi:hypothetical protein